MGEERHIEQNDRKWNEIIHKAQLLDWLLSKMRGCCTVNTMGAMEPRLSWYCPNEFTGKSPLEALENAFLSDQSQPAIKPPHVPQPLPGDYA